MGIVDSVREYFTMRKFMKTPLAQALRHHTQTYFYGNTALTGFSEEAKERLIGGMTQQLGAAFEAENPIIAIREGLVGFTIQYARIQVLCLTEEEKADAFYAGSPHISGELYKSIDDAAPHVEEVDQHRWEQEVGGQELIDFCNVRCAIYLYYMNAFNLARMELGDKTDPDWFRPLVEAQLVYEENTIRDKMGLPLTVGSMIDALAFSVMFNKVADGATNPYYEWCSTWPELHLGERSRR